MWNLENSMRHVILDVAIFTWGYEGHEKNKGFKWGICLHDMKNLAMFTKTLRMDEETIAIWVSDWKGQLASLVWTL